MANKQKVQLNANIDPSYAAAVRQICDTEGRRLGDTVERMIATYQGSPSHLLERLKRFRKSDLNEHDKAALREMQDQITYLLFA